jgi:hypothetical protein
MGMCGSGWLCHSTGKRTIEIAPLNSLLKME